METTSFLKEMFFFSNSSSDNFPSVTLIEMILSKEEINSEEHL